MIKKNSNHLFSIKSLKLIKKTLKILLKKNVKKCKNATEWIIILFKLGKIIKNLKIKTNNKKGEIIVNKKNLKKFRKNIFPSISLLKEGINIDLKFLKLERLKFIFLISEILNRRSKIRKV